MKKCLLIVNPVAGKRTAVKNLSGMERLLHDHGYVCTTVLTEDRGDATRIAAEKSPNADLVICSGGDGTLNEVSRGLEQVHSQKPLGYIPSGSTNDFASSLSIPTDYTKAIDRIAGGMSRPVDMGSFNGRTFVYIAACGAFTRVSYAVPQEKKNHWGWLAYLAEGVRELPGIRPLHLSVEIDGEVFEDDFLWASVTNARSIGGVIKLDESKADLQDGKLEVMLIRKPGDLGRIARALQTGKYDVPEIVFRSAKEIRVHSQQPISWTLDGEQADTQGDVDIACLPGALRLVM